MRCGCGRRPTQHNFVLGSRFTQKLYNKAKCSRSLSHPWLEETIGKYFRLLNPSAGQADSSGHMAPSVHVVQSCIACSKEIKLVVSCGLDAR